MAAGTKLAIEILEKLVDDVARLKSLGKVEEAAQKEIEHAKLYKQFKRDGALDAEAPSSGGPAKSQESLGSFMTSSQPQDLNRPVDLTEQAGLGRRSAGVKQELGTEPPSDLSPRAEYPGLKRPSTLAEAMEKPLDTSAGDTTGGMSTKKKVALGAAGLAGAGTLASRLMDSGLQGGAVPGAPKVEEASVTAEAPKGKTKLEVSASSKASTPTPTATTPEKESELDSLLGRLRGGSQDAKLDSIPFEQERAKAKADLAEARNKQDWMSLGDRIGRSLVQMGAAQQGLKQNVDLSGIKGEPLDTRPIGERAQADFEASSKDISGREKQAQDVVSEANRRTREQEKEANELLSRDYMERLREKGTDRRHKESIASAEKIAKLKADQSETNVKLKAELSPAEKKKAEKDDDTKRQIDRLLTEASADKVTVKDKKKKLEQAYKLAASVYKNPAELEALFTPKEAEGFFSSPEVDIKAIKEYNSRGGAGGSGASEGTVTVTHIPTGKTKTYKAGDPAIRQAESNPDFRIN